MTDKLKQIIERELKKLPKENQEVINAFGWEKISEEIAKKYLLSEREITDLQVQILLILIGLIDSDNFTQDIEKEVGTSKNEAKKISDEVFEKIFIPITNIGIENIKKNLQSKKPNYNQTVNFILSGGNYSAFLEENNNKI